MVVVATSISATVYDLLGEATAKSVDPIILDYVVNVLKDETFDFGVDGEQIFDAVCPLLIDARCLPEEKSAVEFCKALAEKFPERVGHQGENGTDGGMAGEGSFGVRKLGAALRMGEGMPEQRESILKGMKDLDTEAFFLTERDVEKMERKKRKEDRARQMEYESHVRESASLLLQMPVVTVSHGRADGVGGGEAKDVRLENFSITVAGKDLISDASVTLAFGRRYGLVGRNGTGKTTFLKHLAMHALKGIPAGCSILHVEQEVQGEDTRVIDVVLSADVERCKLLAEEKRLLAEQEETEGEQGGGGGEKGASSGERLAAVYKRLEQIGADSAEAAAATILCGLSFTPSMQIVPTKSLSGGWRMRVALAKALFIQPDLLLLDEPTNHLDLHAVLWLESHLVKWKKTLVVVSHAREFLNTVVTDVIHLQNQKLSVYRGNFDTFEKTRSERELNLQKAKEANERTRAHVQSFIDRFRYNAKRASLVQSRIKALERIGTVDDVYSDPDYRFEFPTPEDRPSAPIITFTDVSFGYSSDKLLFKNLNFGIDLDSRLAMVGANGVGKSTLLKLISGELKPTAGTAFRSPKVRLSVFNQHHVDGLDLSKSALLYMTHAFPGTPEQRLRSHLGSFGVSGNLALQPMYTLSGGQKSRVAFAKITFPKPHILLLDEPSNHLDIDAVEALIQGLALFQGGVLMVSHDEHLISGSVDELWTVKDGTAKPFSGTFKEYKKTLKDKMTL